MIDCVTLAFDVTLDFDLVLR